MFGFYHNNITDNMIVAEVAHKTADNMVHNASHNCKFDQLNFFPF